MDQHIDYIVLKKITKGNVGAFEVLYDTYFNRLASYAYTFLKSNELAKEITQEVFLRVWEKREQLDVQYPFIQTGLAFTRNLCIDYLRKEMHKKRFENQQIAKDKELALGALTDPISEKMILKDIQQIVIETLDSLPEVNKKIYLMNREKGLTYNEIASKLEVSVKTVEYRMMQTLKLLRVNLKEFVVICLLFDLFS